MAESDASSIAFCNLGTLKRGPLPPSPCRPWQEEQWAANKDSAESVAARGALRAATTTAKVGMSIFETILWTLFLKQRPAALLSNWSRRTLVNVTSPWRSNASPSPLRPKRHLSLMRVSRLCALLENFFLVTFGVLTSGPDYDSHDTRLAALGPSQIYAEELPGSIITLIKRAQRVIFATCKPCIGTLRSPIGWSIWGRSLLIGSLLRLQWSPYLEPCSWRGCAHRVHCGSQCPVPQHTLGSCSVIFSVILPLIVSGPIVAPVTTHIEFSSVALGF